ncbi:E2F transcription factor-like E2FE [Acorus calamus]|uniref:E2F transcription factor-like E2FE n=1 Tax=Acorus calamus TaxID=4465 RepID=A0AAV9DFY1_ACOCL|nr:E2F transcription factor-like E2FE [Acorus calamus]
MAESGTVHYGYSRKQKSLGLLCTNFLGMYDREGIVTVGLDETASQLGVERRRIYDIVNILESIGVLARKAKNQYSWIGFKGIPQALKDLKEEALKENSLNPSTDVATEVLDNEEEVKTFNLSHNPNASLSTSSVLSVKSKNVIDQRREKSLGQLTQKFIKLFLVSDVDTISLDDASRILLGDINDPSHMRENSAAKVRRLYDIANVLSSMNLLEKTHQSQNRKPAFRWLGFNGTPDNSKDVAVLAKPLSPNQFRSDRSSRGAVCATPLSPKNPIKRTFGTDITNNAEMKKNKVASLVDGNHKKMKTERDELTEGNHTAHKQLGSKNYVFGPFEPAKVIKQEESKDEGMRYQDWENFAADFQPRYQNQALGDLFEHYVEAWKTWYNKATQECDNNKQQHQPSKSTGDQPP